MYILLNLRVAGYSITPPPCVQGYAPNPTKCVTPLPCDHKPTSNPTQYVRTVTDLYIEKLECRV